MGRGRDYYQILGVKQSASADEIKRAYRKMAKKYHPDRNRGDASAEEKFKDVQAAHDVLKDPDKRAQYDRFGEAGVGQFATRQSGQKVYQWGANSAVNAEDLEDLFSAFGGGGGSQSSVFEQFFGGGGRRRAPAPTPRQGADVRRPISLTFEQAIHGAEVSVQLTSSQGDRTETLDVKIPPGVVHGQKIRIPGRGQGGVHGGSPGDFYLVCSVPPHPYFVREGADILVDVPVTIAEAALGAKIDVPTVAGSATVTLPPGTAGGSRLRLKSGGAPKADGTGKGDQYVIIRIVPPDVLTDERRRLYEQLRELDPDDPRAECLWNVDAAGKSVP